MPPFVSAIIKEKRPCFFISPHLDDAALSCGGLISEIASKTEVTIVTVFTDVSEEKLTFSAKKALADAHMSNPSAYYAKRREEDKKAFAHLPVKLIHVGKTEALYRRKPHLTFIAKVLGVIIPEFLFVYPTYRFHMSSGHVSSQDTAVIASLTKQLAKLFPRNAVIFAPTGVGGHVDHQVVRLACEEFHPIYWLDQPYLDRVDTKEAESYKEHAIALPMQISKKQKIIDAYASQMPLLFQQGKQSSLQEYFQVPESFYTEK